MAPPPLTTLSLECSHFHENFTDGIIYPSRVAGARRPLWNAGACDNETGGDDTAFARYQHIEHLTSDKVSGIGNGTCYVFPKLDGANTCAYVEDGEIKCGSRNRPLDGTTDFDAYVRSNNGIVSLLTDHPELRLFGEWMIPHSIRDYVPDTWNRWFVFDVTSDTGEFHDVIDGEPVDHSGDRYLPYPVYRRVLEHYGIDYVPAVAVLENPTLEQVELIADTCDYWMPKGSCGEGVVVKRYGYRSMYGDETWAKVLSSRFREIKDFDHRRRQSETSGLEEELARDMVTWGFVEKEYSRIASETSGEVNPGRLLTTVWKTFVEENIWDILRRKRNPTIDFRKLKRAVESRVKEARPDVFGGDSDEDARRRRREAGGPVGPDRLQEPRPPDRGQRRGPHRRRRPDLRGPVRRDVGLRPLHDAVGRRVRARCQEAAGDAVEVQPLDPGDAVLPRDRHPGHPCRRRHAVARLLEGWDRQDEPAEAVEGRPRDLRRDDVGTEARDGVHRGAGGALRVRHQAGHARVQDARPGEGLRRLRVRGPRGRDPSRRGPEGAPDGDKVREVHPGGVQGDGGEGAGGHAPATRHVRLRGAGRRAQGRGVREGEERRQGLPRDATIGPDRW